MSNAKAPQNAQNGKTVEAPAPVMQEEKALTPATVATPHNLALEAPRTQKAMLRAAQKVVSAQVAGDAEKLQAARKSFGLALTENGAGALIGAEDRLKEAQAWLESRGGSSLFSL